MFTRTWVGDGERISHVKVKISMSLLILNLNLNLSGKEFLWQLLSCLYAPFWLQLTIRNVPKTCYCCLVCFQFLRNIKRIDHLQTHRFQIMLFFRKEPPLKICLGFTFNKVGGLSMAEVESLHVFFNRTTTKTQLMQGNVPWRGPCEKDLDSLQFLIEAFTKPKDVIIDAYASMG